MICKDARALAMIPVLIAWQQLHTIVTNNLDSRAISTVLDALGSDQKGFYVILFYLRLCRQSMPHLSIEVRLNFGLIAAKKSNLQFVESMSSIFELSAEKSSQAPVNKSSDNDTESSCLYAGICDSVTLHWQQQQQL
jgi:hypothetical protein